MKNIIKIVLPVLLLTISCKAQIESLEDYDGKGVSGKYYKDLNNVLAPFAGTYLYTNGNISFKVVLQKMEHSSMGGVYYEDLLIGEYEYKIDNVIVVSTLNKLNNTYDNGASHSISGNGILIGNSRGCRDCLPTEKRVSAGLVNKVSYREQGAILDTPQYYSASLLIRRKIVAGQPAIEFYVGWEMYGVDKTKPRPPGPSFPGGDYIMMRQP